MTALTSAVGIPATASVESAAKSNKKPSRKSWVHFLFNEFNAKLNYFFAYAALPGETTFNAAPLLRANRSLVPSSR